MTISQLKYEIDCIDDFYNSLIKEGLIESCRKQNHPPNCWLNAELEIHNKLLELKNIKEKESVFKSFKFDLTWKNIDGWYKAKGIKFPFPEGFDFNKNYTIEIKEK